MKIKNIIKNRFRIYLYNWYITDLSAYKDKPAIPEKLKGYSDMLGTENITDDHFSEFPAEIKTIWFNFHKENSQYKTFFLLNPEGKIVLYIFYLAQEKISLKELPIPLSLRKNEVYLSTGRTLAQYSGKGLYQYGKCLLYYHLFHQGFRHAHGLINNKNGSNNHISRKLNIPLKNKILLLRIFHHRKQFNLQPDHFLIKLLEKNA